MTHRRDPSAHPRPALAGLGFAQHDSLMTIAASDKVHRNTENGPSQQSKINGQAPRFICAMEDLIYCFDSWVSVNWIGSVETRTLSATISASKGFNPLAFSSYLACSGTTATSLPCPFINPATISTRRKYSCPAFKLISAPDCLSFERNVCFPGSIVTVK